MNMKKNMEKKLIGILVCTLVLTPTFAMAIAADGPQPLPETKEKASLRPPTLYEIFAMPLDNGTMLINAVIVGGGDWDAFMFDWGDGTFSKWIDVHGSSYVNVIKSWPQDGSYFVRVKAKNHNGEREWSKGTLIIFHRNAYLSVSVIGGMNHVYAVVQNIGCYDATDIEYKIEFMDEGVIEGRITKGVRELIRPGEMTGLQSDFVFGNATACGLQTYIRYFNGVYTTITGDSGWADVKGDLIITPRVL